MRRASNIVLLGLLLVVSGFGDCVEGPLRFVFIEGPDATALTEAQTVTMTATAQGGSGTTLEEVRFYYDGEMISTDAEEPYTHAWTVTAAENGPHRWYAEALYTWPSGNETLRSDDLVYQVAITRDQPPPTPSQTGIASQYPGDTGIGSDPDVLFYEDFADANLNTMAQNWTNTSSPNPTQMQLTQDPAPGSADGQALKMMTSGGIQSSLYRKLPSGTDEIFVRYYVRYPNGPYHHNGPIVGGYNPSSDWPLGSCCTPPDGDRGFAAHAEVLNDTYNQTHWPGPTHPFGYYVYWTDMPTAGDWCHPDFHSLLTSDPNNAGCAAGAHFLKEDYRIPVNEWTLVEIRLKLNSFSGSTPQSDGELEMFINGAPVMKNGQKVSLFPGFKWRTVPEVKANYIWINNHYNSGAAAGTQSVYEIDQLVVARRYIGPISSE